MFASILHSLRLENEKLVIMIDEFTETLENIIEDEGDTSGRHFLQVNRELRQDTDIKNVQFIYTGSIGLENVVSRLNAVNTINDMVRLKIPTLSYDEAKQMINKLLRNVHFILADGVIDYILGQIEWLIPFYIQLIMDELRNISRDKEINVIQNSYVDEALREMMEQRKNYSFVKDVLNIVSEQSEISSNEILDLAVKYDLEVHYKDTIGSLVYDGYINNYDDLKTYRFNSPILKMWWRQNVAN